MDVAAIGKICPPDAPCVLQAFEACVGVDFHEVQVPGEGGNGFVREAGFLLVWCFLGFPSVPVARGEVGMVSAEAGAGREQFSRGLPMVGGQLSAFDEVVADGVEGGCRLKLGNGVHRG